MLTIATLGDSITANYAADTYAGGVWTPTVENYWQYKLLQLLGETAIAVSADTTTGCTARAGSLYVGSERRVFNRGINGDDTTGMLARFAADVTPTSPDVVLILAGTNDLYGIAGYEKALELYPDDEFPDPPSMAQTKSNLLALEAAVLAIGAVPVIGTLPREWASVYDESYGAFDVSARLQELHLELNPWIRSTFANVIDYDAAFNAAWGGVDAPDRLTYMPDGVHPNAAGTTVMAEAALGYFESLLPPAYYDLATAFLPALVDGSASSDGEAHGSAGVTTPAAGSIATDSDAQGVVEAAENILAYYDLAAAFVVAEAEVVAGAAGSSGGASGGATDVESVGGSARTESGVPGRIGQSKGPYTLALDADDRRSTISVDGAGDVTLRLEVEDTRLVLDVE